MRSTTYRIATLLFGAALAASACTNNPDTRASDVQPGNGSSTTAEASDTVAAETDPVESGPAVDDAIALDQLDPDTRTMVRNMAVGYERADGVWSGFVPNDHPNVIVIKERGAVTGAIAFNHPDPDALGNATPVALDGLPFTSLHRITEPTDREAMEQLTNFDFHAMLGGVDSFAMEASDTEPFFDRTRKDYIATVLHEMFHRYQDQAFKGQTAGQDIEGYAYTAENLELAVLEERALSKALSADNDEDRRRDAARFAAIRQARLAADDRVALDNSQEMIEGTARYIEHRTAGEDQDVPHQADNYGDHLTTDFEDVQGVKDTFGFGRWYASGAAVLRTLDLLGIDGVAGRVEAGESPAAILAAELNITAANRDELVDEARADYDPLNSLPEGARQAAELAKTEPPVFGDESEGRSASDGPGNASDGAGTALTEEEQQCLADQGVDLDDDGVEITDEQWDACIA